MLQDNVGAALSQNRKVESKEPWAPWRESTMERDLELVVAMSAVVTLIQPRAVEGM